MLANFSQLLFCTSFDLLPPHLVQDDLAFHVVIHEILQQSLCKKDVLDHVGLLTFVDMMLLRSEPTIRVFL